MWAKIKNRIEIIRDQLHPQWEVNSVLAEIDRTNMRIGMIAALFFKREAHLKMRYPIL